MIPEIQGEQTAGAPPYLQAGGEPCCLITSRNVREQEVGPFLTVTTAVPPILPPTPAGLALAFPHTHLLTPFCSACYTGRSRSTLQTSQSRARGKQWVNTCGSRDAITAGKEWVSNTAAHQIIKRLRQEESPIFLVFRKTLCNYKAEIWVGLQTLCPY